VVVGNVSGVLVVGVVFGALLGPEATGPFCSNALETGVSFVPASGIAVSLCWGVVVWLMGLLFENYIVDASIWNTHVCVFLQQFLFDEPGLCGRGSLE
jgi:hypothetical protein